MELSEVLNHFLYSQAYLPHSQTKSAHPCMKPNCAGRLCRLCPDLRIHKDNAGLNYKEHRSWSFGVLTMHTALLFDEFKSKDKLTMNTVTCSSIMLGKARPRTLDQGLAIIEATLFCTACTHILESTTQASKLRDRDCTSREWEKELLK